MSESLKKTVNIFLKNTKITNYKDKSKPLLKVMPMDDGNSSRLKKSFNTLSLNKQKKKVFDFKKLRLKTFLNDNDNESDSNTQIFLSPKKSYHLTSNLLTSQRDGLDSLRIKPNILKNVLRTKNKKRTSILCLGLFNKRKKEKEKEKEKEKDKNDDDKDKKNNSFKLKRKECKSSSMDGFKKRYKIYKDYLLEKENNDNIKNYDLFQNKTSNNNNNNLDYLQIKKSNKNINNNNNNHNNQQKKTINDNKGYLYGNKKSNTLLLGKNINENKKLKSPEIRKKGHQLPSSNSDSFQKKKFRKKSTNLILQCHRFHTSLGLMRTAQLLLLPRRKVL